MFKILFIGDIFGKVGRAGVCELLPKLKKNLKINLVIANVENLAHGKGVTERTLKEIKEAGVDVFTSGNHIWKKRKEAEEIFQKQDFFLLRPANYPMGVPGIGEKIFTIDKKKILIINLIGRVFFKEDFDCPFRTIDKILKKYKKEKLFAIIIDFHKEASSEARALGFYVDGRVSAVLGTHTHVPTADTKILPNGTAYVTDAGMVGAEDSVIGVEKESVIESYLTQINHQFVFPEKGECVFNSVLLEIDLKTGKAINIRRVDKKTMIG
ncbi:TIGR00282 family metallophosphoesterase [Candidatus Kuenenbacteria bacterium HGW-Kuenenbacteria-1]|uniref:TIGR00282 family metallophosphoesterase n=1 Tax=Candidatus Kuenenbacteria bacterium HGW-Kuenenbacteria-1 TaxID=2013812 RepID=A0A2N1UNT4_9BACT|nr:MAG: TIGR00282 family metallophosphoesterase [Candidatus Kuenenbacteria bacterium HGW-Kuenenbacteria-1]